MLRPARNLVRTFHSLKECRPFHTNKRQRAEIAEYECKKLVYLRYF